MNYSEYTHQDFIQILEEKEVLLEKQARRIRQLELELGQIKRMIFGSKSERFEPAIPPEQMRMFNTQTTDSGVHTDDNIEDQPVVAVKKKKRKKAVRKKLPAHLERKEQLVEPEVDVSTMRYIGQEITEKLEMTPAQFYVRKIVRHKYVDPQGQIHIGSLPSDPFPKCIAGASVGASVAINKYVDHLPLYRQNKIYARQDIDLPRSTLNGMISRGSDLVLPLYEKLDQIALASNYLQADESSLKVLTKDHPNGNIKGCMLVKVAPEKEVVVMDYIRTKEKFNIYKSLKGFQGYLQVDGNVSYESLGNLEHIELMHCLVHSRRYFDKAKDYNLEQASFVLTLIQQLYSIERHAKEEKLDPNAILKLRQDKSVPILEKLKEWLNDNVHHQEPSDPLNKAARYMLKRWDGLIKYTTNGMLSPDNNLIENQIRPLALGRKNYLFAGSHKGAEYAAVFYSLFATCKLNGLEPLKWLTDVYRRIQDHPINKIEELLPLHGYQFLT